MTRYSRNLTVIVAVVTILGWPERHAVAQVKTATPQPPVVMSREMELTNWVGIPNGEDIAIMAIEFQPPLLPGMTAAQMSEIYSSISNGQGLENPLAQLMMAVQQGEPLSIKSAVEKIAIADSKDAEAQFLGGLWAESKRGDSLAAIKWFLRARDLVEDVADKSFIDRYILGSALLADPDSVEAQTAGVEAALRLADSFWNAGGGTARALGEMLSDFGRLDAGAEVIAAAKGIVAPEVPLRGRRSSTSYQEVVSAFAAGDRDQGLQVAVTGVKQAVQSFAQAGSLNNVNYTYRQMVQFVSAFGLRDPVLEQLRPGEGASIEEMANFAIAAEMLNRLDLAVPEYRRLLAEHPDQHAVRWRLIVNSIGNPSAQDLLKDFPPDSLQQYGATLSNLLQSEQDFVRRLEIVELIRSFIDTLKPDLTGDLRWVTNVLGPLVDDFYSDDVRVVSLHQINGRYSFDSEAQERRSAALAEKRADVHKRICESMLRHPTLASAAFASISGFANMPEWPTEAEFTELARALLASKQSPDEPFYYSHQASASSVLRLQPAQYLFKQAVDSGSMAVIDGEVIPMVKAAGKSVMAESMEAFSRLYSCASDDYVGVAFVIVETGVGGVTADSLINYIQLIAQQREIDVDLGPLVLSTIRKSRELSNNVPYSARNYVTSLYAAKGADAAATFVDGVAEIYLGPIEEQSEFVRKHYASRTRQGEPSAYAHAFKEFLERFSSPMGVVVLAVRKYLQCGYGNVADSNMANRFQNAVRSYRFDDSYSATYMMLDNSPWLKSVDEFQVWPMRHLSSGSCYNHLIQQIKQSSSSIRKNMVSHIQSVKPETFGKNLTLACLAGESQPAVASVISTHLKQLEMMPLERQKELAAWYQKFLSDHGNAGSRSSDVAAVGSWIARLNAADRKAGGDPVSEDQSVTERGTITADASPSSIEPPPISPMVRAFLDAQTPSQVSSRTLLHQHVVPILVSVIDDPELCARIFAHYRELATMSQRARGGRSPGQDSFDSQLLASVVQQVDPTRSAQGRSFPALVAIFASQAGRSVIPGQGLNSVLGAIYAASRSDVSPGVRVVLGTKVTPERDAVAALLLAATAPYRSGGRTVYGMRLNSLAGLAKANGWAQTGAVLSGDDFDVTSSLLRLDSAPVGLRLMAASANPFQSPENTALVASLAIAAFDQGASLPLDTLMGLIKVYLELGEPERSDDWSAMVKRLLHGAVQSVAPGSLSAEQFVFLLNAAGKTGYSSRRIQLRFGQNFAQQPWFLAMLVKHRQFAAARRQLRSQLAQMQLPQVPAAGRGAAVMPSGNVIGRSASSRPDGTRRITEQYDSGEEIIYIEDQSGNRTIEGGAGSAGPVVFDNQLEAAIPDFVATLQDPGLATLAELILLATPDPPASKTGIGSTESTDESGVRKRVIAASTRIADERVDNPFIEERILSILAPIALESPGLRERIAAYGRNVDVVALAMFEDEAIKQPRQLIFKAYLDAALIHQPDDFAAMMEQLLTSRQSGDHRVVRALQFYGGGFPDVLFQAADGFSRARADRYISVFRKLLEVGGSRTEWPKRLDCLNGAIICHVLAGKSADFTTWFASLDEALQSMFRAQVQLQRLLQLVSKPLSSSGMPDDEKVAILGSLMEAKLFPMEGSGKNADSGESTAQVLQGGGETLFKSLLDEGVLPRAALLKSGSRWAAMNPRNGAAWAEIAALQTEDGKQQQALESWVMAVSSVPWDNRTRYSSYHLEAAKLLLKMDRLEPALTWFEFFNRGRLDEEFELELDTLHRDTRYKVMMRQGRTEDLLADALASLEGNRSDIPSWQQLGSVLDAMGRNQLAEGNMARAVPMLEIALLVMTKTTAENPALGTGQLNDVFEALMEGRTGLGEFGGSVRFIPKGADWRYFYSVAAPARWEQPDFDDSDWLQGVGQFGYGDDDEATLLEWGSDPDDKPITAYFRKVFNVEDLADVSLLAIDLVRDDGAVVYLNGIEVRRDNLPEGRLLFATEALTSPKKSEENDYRRKTLAPDLLRKGRNVIAVEVHQNDPDSSDLSFDLQLSSNTLSMEETVKALDIEVMKQEVSQNAPMVQLQDWMWKALDLARQPSLPSTGILENNIQLDSILLDGGNERLPRRVILPPPVPR